jgi:hypothetical protein
MTPVVLACLALVVSTTMLHYEALRLLTAILPRLRMVPRARLIVVILASFAVHALEIVLYAAATYALVRGTSAGTLGPAMHRHGRRPCTSLPRPTRRWATATSCHMVLCGRCPARKP